MNSLMEDLGPALVLMIVAALLGGLIVYLWFRNRYARLEERTQQLSTESANLSSSLASLKKQYAQAELQAKGCNEKLAPLQGLLEEKDKAFATVSARLVALEKDQEALASYQVKYEDLQVRYQAMEDAVMEIKQKSAPRKEAPVVDKSSAAISEELAREKALRMSLAAQLEGIRPFRQKYEDLKEKYDALLEANQAPSVSTPPTVAVADPVSAQAASAVIQESPAPKESQEETLARIQARAQEINFERIGVATAAEKDDLKLVKGIGPFIEVKLNSIGIYTFRQIAAFTEEDEDKVNEVIEFFPGRIRRDSWSKQAADLHKEKQPEAGK